jgi:GGDEF domain-containing protein
VWSGPIEVGGLQAGDIAEKIRACLAMPYRLSLSEVDRAGLSVEHHCTASVGVITCLGHEASQSNLMNRTDSAM